MQKYFSSIEVAELTKTHIGCFKAWLYEGYISPLCDQDTSTTNVRWARHDIRVIAFFKYILDKGYSRKKAAEIACNYGEFGENAHYFLHVNDKNYYLSEDLAGVEMIMMSYIRSANNINIYVLDNILKDLFSNKEE